MSDARERSYEAAGIDSSYLFRVDLEWVLDATFKARFVVVAPTTPFSFFSSSSQRCCRPFPGGFPCP